MLNKLYKKIMKDMSKSVMKNKWVVKTYKDVVVMCYYYVKDSQCTFYCEFFHEGTQWRVMSSSEGYAVMYRNDELCIQYDVNYEYVSAYDLFQLLVKAALGDCLFN